MRCDCGSGARFAVGFHARQIKGLEQSDGAGSARLKVNAAAEFLAVQRNNFAGGPSSGVGGIDADDDLSVYVHHHGDGCAEHPRVQVTCCVEDGIAQGFCLDSSEVLAGEQPIFWVSGIGCWTVVGGLFVGGGVEDEAVEMFDAPVVLGEFGGEPVEQLGVRGTVAMFPEVAGCSHDSFAEEMVPNAVC